MLKNYFALALRQLRKNRGYSFINIAGLATGMAVALVIGIWTADELSHDKSYPGHARIGEIMQGQKGGAWAKDQEKTWIGPTLSSAVKPLLKKGYDDIFAQTALLSYPSEHLLVAGDRSVSSISMAIAMPLIGLAMQKWLHNYALHTNLSPYIFLLAGAGMLLITLATVSFQALKAALMNPVKSLRNE